MKITSPTNPKIKTVAKLREAKNRKALRLSLIEGLREITRAYESGVKFKEIFYCPEIVEKLGQKSLLNKLKKQTEECVEVSLAVFKKIAFGERAEGLVAVFEPQYLTLDQIEKGKRLFIVVDQLEKPGNLGAILRTTDAVGVDAVLASDSKTDIFNPNIIRASLGAIFCVPIVSGKAVDIHQFLKSQNVAIVVATPQAQISYTQEDYQKPVAFVLGSEEKGVSRFWLKQADKKVNLPMQGKVDSLNVSITAAVLLYEVLRQRNKGTH